MTYLTLDDQSRLTFFEAVPQQLRPAGDPVPPAEWSELFKLADLDPSQFQKTEPLSAPPRASDERMSWTGVYPRTSIPLRVEAAAWLGKPVFFKLAGPWTQPSSERSVSAGARARIVLLLTLGIIILIVPAWLAWRNIARGKADRRGAFRLSGAIFCAYMLLWIFRAHFTAAAELFGVFAMALAAALFNSALVWTVYLALEPYVRRHWPHSIISWSRLTNGQLRDPAVGRDVLFGVVMGTLWTMIILISNIVSRAVGGEPSLPNTDYLEGARSILGAWIYQVPSAVRTTLVFFFILFVLRALLRNKWLAAAVFVAIFTLVQALGSAHPAIDVPVAIAIYVISAVALVRFGLVTLAAAVFTVDSIGRLPITMNPSSWYFGSTMFVMASVVLLAAWAFHAATAGRKLFTADLFE
jgi:serine/threonine-protein kinase